MMTLDIFNIGDENRLHFALFKINCVKIQNISYEWNMRKQTKIRISKKATLPQSKNPRMKMQGDK